jgi:1-acyl-sn-glycerol-3-phosphate acyltransferase
LFLELTTSLLRGEPRSLLADTLRMVDALPAPPRIYGQEYVPAGPFVLVANHYQRRDLWIGWAGSLLIQAVGRSVHWLTLRESRFRGRELPLTRGLFTRVARTYGFIPLPADLRDHAGQALAIRRAVRLLRTGEVLGLFPEGQRGSAGTVSPALPGTPRLACLLSRYAPLLPAAVWEGGGRLHASIGPPFRLSEPSPASLMDQTAHLLSEQMLAD